MNKSKPLKKTKSGLNQTKKIKESQPKKVKNPTPKLTKKTGQKTSSQRKPLLEKKSQKKNSANSATTKANAKIKTKIQSSSKNLSQVKYSIDLQNMQKNSKKAESMLKMLANSKRLMILCHIFKGKKTVGDLTKLVSLSHSALSQHLAKMRALNLVESEKIGQEVFYRIESKEIEAILSTLYLIYCK